MFGRGIISILVLFCLLGAVWPVSAFDVDGTATSYYRYWKELNLPGYDEQTRAPLHQYLDVSLSGFSTIDLTVTASLLGFQDLEAEEGPDDDPDGEVYTLQLQGRDLFGLLDFRIGRQFMSAGLRPITLDGGWVELQPLKNLYLGAYGGLWRDLQVGTHEKTHDEAYGMTVSFRGFSALSASIGYHQRAEDAGEIRIGSVELGSRLLNAADLSFQFDYDFENERVLELLGRLSVESGRWRFRVDGSRYDPDLDDTFTEYLSPFRIFAGGRQDEAAGSVSVELLPNLELFGRAGWVRYQRLSNVDQDGSSYRVGVRSVSWRRPWLSYEFSVYRLDLDNLESVGVRVNGFADLFDWLTLGAGVETADYTKIDFSGDQVDDDARTYMVSADVTPVDFLTVGAMVEDSVNVEYEENTRVSARLQVRF